MRSIIPIFAIIIKELKLLLRDPGGFIMLFILPVSFIFILSVSLQGTFASPDNRDKLDIIIINNDTENESDQIIEELKKTGFFNILTEVDNKKITLEDAKKYIQKGKYKIAVNIPENATKSIQLEDKSEITIYVDPILSNDFVAHITNAIQSYVHVAMLKNIGEKSISVFKNIKSERLNEIDKQITDAKNKKQEIIDMLNEFKRTQMDRTTLSTIEDLNNQYIIEFDERIANLKAQKTDLLKEEITENNNNMGLLVKQVFYSKANDDGVYPNSVQHNVPGWTIFALFWIVQIITINMITERKSGAFKRILVAPINSLQFILGKVIPFFFVNLLQAVFMFAIGVFILPLVGCPSLELTNIPALILVTVSISIVAISFGLFISTISKSLFLAASLSGIIVIIMTVVAGIMIPKFIMPSFMQFLSYFVPQGWALEAYLNILVKNYTVIDVLPHIGVLLLFASIFFIFSLINFKRISKIS